MQAYNKQVVSTDVVKRATELTMINQGTETPTENCFLTVSTIHPSETAAESERERWGRTEMIVRTLGSACRLLEIHWQKGRQASKTCTCTHSLPTFLAAPSNFLSLPKAIC